MPEPIAERRPVTVSMGGIPVPLPIGAFLQATEPTEAAIREAVSQAIGPADGIGDLFAGCGTFSLPFAAAGRRVIAFERDQAMVNAMNAAARSAGIEQHLIAYERDLDRQPLDQTDLESLDALIIDPPRAGARTQVNALAASAIKKIAMVSCNPATFARDARILEDGGYRLAWIQPIDAFLWSAQIELVAAFEHHGPS
jgi:23S rRNA (uracil1939-C5)-methyltransferase